MIYLVDVDSELRLNTMASKQPGSKPRPSDDELHKLAPLIPERNKYVYRSSPMTVAACAIAAMARHKKVKITVPDTQYATCKLVHVLCSAAEANVWDKTCEKALINHLPLREHHRALLSHSMFVTMIGTVVARALEQATSRSEKTLDLLTDRHYVKNIVCHDRSKTSKMEAAGYSGIMAVYMEKKATAVNARTREQLERRHECDRPKTVAALEKLHADVGVLVKSMASFGLKHHYENNPHHPEHFPSGKMNDLSVVEAVVDGLACVFERCHTIHKTPGKWLDMYNLDRFSDDNKDFAKNIISCLKAHITEADYRALTNFRQSITDIVGESVPWSGVGMSDCCGPVCNYVGGDGKNLSSRLRHLQDGSAR